MPTERIDIAIRLGPSYRADVIGTKLFNTRYRVVASASYVEGHPNLKIPSDLTTAGCLLFSLPEFRTRWVFRSRSAEFVVPVSGHLVISNALALRSAALDGLGPALLADWLVDNDIEKGALVDLFPQFAVMATTFDTAAWLLYPSRDYLPRKIRATIDFVREKNFASPKVNLADCRQVGRCSSWQRCLPTLTIKRRMDVHPSFGPDSRYKPYTLACWPRMTGVGSCVAVTLTAFF